MGKLSHTVFDFFVRVCYKYFKNFSCSFLNFAIFAKKIKENLMITYPFYFKMAEDEFVSHSEAL